MTAAQFTVLLLVTGVIMVLLLIARGGGGRLRMSDRRLGKSARTNTGVAGSGAQAPGPRRCPLCGEQLGPGERLRTRVFEIQRHGGSVGESFVHVFGCPHCDAREQTRHDARCPACQRKLQPGEVVFARLFVRENRRDHLRVLGCSTCRPQARLQAGAPLHHESGNNRPRERT